MPHFHINFIFRYILAMPTVVHVDGGMVNPTYKAEFQPPPPYSEFEHPGPDVNVNHVEGVEPIGLTPGAPMAMGVPNEDPATSNKNMDGNAIWSNNIEACKIMIIHVKNYILTVHCVNFIIKKWWLLINLKNVSLCH